MVKASFLKLKADDTQSIQSCITNVSFPKTLEKVLNVVAKYDGQWITDLDSLLAYDINDPDYDYFGWTVPKWLTEGDIIFFYHAYKAREIVPNLLNKARREYGPESNLAKMLERSKSLADRYSAKIFGCAILNAPPEHFQPDPDIPLHFESTIFADVAQIHIFDHPLDKSQFGEFVKILNGPAITPLSGGAASGLKEKFSQNNPLPEYLQSADFDDIGFHDIDRFNWPNIACAQATRFIHEAQLRAYFIDYFLLEIKDKGTPLLEECDCYKTNKCTGTVDYFIQLQGVWIPVEAKLNILSEPKLFDQIDKYLDVESFKPTKGRNIQTVYKSTKTHFCLIIDQSGVYLADEDGFIESNFSQPLIKRTDINFKALPNIRKQLGELLTP